MADVNANIDVNINTSGALAQLKALQREIARFHTSVAKSSDEAAIAQRNLQKNFINGVNSIQGFSAELRTVKTTAESFTDSLQKNKLSMREYFRYSAASTKTFGRFFKSELDTLNKTALENVKRLQTQYIKMGRDANGAMRAIAITPTRLDLKDLTTQTQIAAQKQAIFNQLVRQGSTNLLNFGKNTQWAGRQLMVGFTLPLIGLGSAASKTFMDMETAAIKFRKVYGDLFTPTEEREQALADIQELGREFTKYGIAIAETTSLAADAAAAGFQGIDLQRQVTAATRLQVLGQIEQQKALETTISLQNAFRLSSADLADSINFLNAVENQTVVSLDDITTAIPKAAPIVRELGGDVKDLAFFMAAMKEGGINASEGANALKSGLASLINPSDKARDMLNGFGIDIDNIVNKNAGNVKQTVVEFAMELDKLSSLSRQRAIEQLFGKFQQARLSALFDNVIRDGNQAARVLDLAGTSVEELASLAEQELGVTANSSMFKFRKAVEQLKASLAPVGKIFLEIVTPFLENIGKILDKFNNLSEGSKKVIASLVIGIGAIAPIVLMTFGLLANFVANGIKGIMLLRNGYLRLTGQSQILSEQTNFLTVEQQQALAAAASLEQSHMKLQQVFTGEAAAVRLLINEYQRMIAAQNMAATRFPAMMQPGFKLNKYKDGKPLVVGGTGNQDTELALLAPGETVLPADMSKKFAPLINAMIANNVPGYEKGKTLGKKVILPGGMDVSHFGSKKQMRGEDLVALFEGIDTAAANKIREIVGKFEDGSQRMFTVFDNQVVAMFSEINRGLDKEGKFNLQKVKENLVGKGFSEVRDIELQAQFEAAGKSVEDFKLANQQITEAIKRGFEKLGDATDITEEQVSQLIETAYTEVSQENENVKQAVARMRQISTITEPDVGGVRGKRVALTRESYVKKKRGKDSYKQNMLDLVGEENIPYNLNAEFVISNQVLDKLQISGDRAAAIFKKMSDEAKINLAKLKGDANAFVEQFTIEAQRVGETIGNASIDGIAKGTQSASPSQEAKIQGQNVVDGFEQGILEGMDDASLAASKVKNSAMQGLAGGNIPGYGPLKFGEPIDWQQQTIPFEENLTPAVDSVSESLDNLSDTTTGSKQKLSKFNDRMMAGSFALSGITGVMTLFGNNMGGVTDKIFKVSSALFALQGIVQALTSAKLLELAATRASTVAGAMQGLGKTAAGKQIPGSVGALFTRGGGFATFGKNLLTAGRFALRFAGPVGLAATAGFAVYKVFTTLRDRAEESRRKIEGLGDAADLTGKKLTAIEKIFGVDLATTAAERFRAGGKKAEVALTTTRRSRAEDVLQSEEFKTFEADVKSLKEATPKQAQAILETIGIELQARGLAKESVQAFIDALIIESGQKDVKIDFNKIDINTDTINKTIETNVTKTLNKYKKALESGMGNETRRQANASGKVIASTFETLQMMLESGTISADQYKLSINGINTQLLAMPNNASKLALVNAMIAGLGEEAQEAVSSISDMNAKILASIAISLNIQNPDVMKDLSSEDFEVKAKALKKLEKLIIDYINKQAEVSAEENKNESGNGNNSLDKQLTRREKLVKMYEREQSALEKKLDKMKEVNDEISRQNELVQSQMDLQNQITEAKISGNYLEAASLVQQKMSDLAEFNRETKEIELQKRIDKINERIDKLESDQKNVVLTAAEKRMINLFDKKYGTKNKEKKKISGKPGGTQNDPETQEQPEKEESIFPGGPQKTSKRFIPEPPKAANTPLKLSSWYFNKDTNQWEQYALKAPKPKNAISLKEWQEGKRTYGGEKKSQQDKEKTQGVIPQGLLSKQIPKKEEPKLRLPTPGTKLNMPPGVTSKQISFKEWKKGNRPPGATAKPTPTPTPTPSSSAVPKTGSYNIFDPKNSPFGNIGKERTNKEIIDLFSLPKFKLGISDVPYDMPAILHQGERVLTKEENKRYGNNSSTINATFNISGSNSDEIVNKVMVKLNTLANKNNKSNRVSI